ncbi:hypothetical protein D7Y27_32420 [Corallococcus sp. AB004]|nr:hypothetical protein D7Y04_22230 [Corallococcus sp. AB038B]RKI35227.1 hypothetical protein D7Y27_32420 [Corallococcus sp. AB004]
MAHMGGTLGRLGFPSEPSYATSPPLPESPRPHVWSVLVTFVLLLVTDVVASTLVASIEIARTGLDPRDSAAMAR